MGILSNDFRLNWQELSARTPMNMQRKARIKRSLKKEWKDQDEA
jgi:hypothetical protein